MKVFSGRDGSLLSCFLAFGRSAGGVRVAAGDINGDGYADIIAGSGTGSGVSVFDGRNPANILKSFTAFAPAYQGGVTVASGDVDGDGLDDIIVGKARGASTARIQLGKAGSSPVLFNLFGASTQGINIATADVNGDGIADIIAAQARNARAQIRIYAGKIKLSAPPVPLMRDITAFAYDPAYIGGMFVG